MPFVFIHSLFMCILDFRADRQLISMQNKCDEAPLRSFLRLYAPAVSSAKRPESRLYWHKAISTSETAQSCSIHRIIIPANCQDI